ncbi:MAG TPA: MXAN_5187 C-terminal domain-containing protein [Thermoanaerobaculia bacterium]|nr:MXAN_5187 C-terminal domain-containing protein [Thermoanaerobaculia bacterium]
MDPKRSPRGGMGGAPASPQDRAAAGPGAAAGSAAARAAAAAGRQAPARSAAPTVSEAIDRLAGEIRQLRVDFERFFSGALALPPDELRRRVQADLRQLRNVNAMTAVERFRLSDLEARHNSYDELFSRRLRDREEGRRRAGQTAVAAPPSPPPARYDPGAGIVIGHEPDPRAVAALYDGLTTVGAAGGSGEGPRFDLASFGSYLQRQAAAIRDKTGCAEVQFRLAAEDGKLKLKARPVPAAPKEPPAPRRPGD